MLLTRVCALLGLMPTSWALALARPLPNSFIVVIDDNVSIDDFLYKLRQRGPVQVTTWWDAGEEEEDSFSLIHGVAMRTAAYDLDDLRRLEEVKHAELDQTVSTYDCNGSPCMQIAT